MIRTDYIIASLFRWLDGFYSNTAIHWPGAESGATDTAWIEPFIDIQETPSSTEYGRVTFEINIFTVDTDGTYAIWVSNGLLAETMRRAQIDIRNWPDGGGALLGCVRMFDPVSTYFGHMPVMRTGPRGGIQKINLRVEGVLIGA